MRFWEQPLFLSDVSNVCNSSGCSVQRFEESCDVCPAMGAINGDHRWYI
jgi:hypothetical protein